MRRNEKTKKTAAVLFWTAMGMLFTGSAFGAEARLFLQNNIHAQHSSKDIKASYANWTDPGAGHMIIPVNTPVIFSRGGHIRRSVFTMTLQDTGKIVRFEFDKKRMAMEPEEYWKLIAAPSQVNLKALSEIDQKGIREGKVHNGMTKDGVRIALGYPAAHMTLSLNENRWIYWTNRFKSFAVVFGTDGKVVGAH